MLWYQELHAEPPARQPGCQLSRLASQPRSSCSAGAPTAMTAVLAAAVGPVSGRTLAVAAVACTPGTATASAPARRQSETIAAGVSCGSTSPNASCAAAAAAHH